MATKCRRCSECVGMSHHWIDDILDPDSDDFEPGDYGCKHCDARGEECGDCVGTGMMDSGGFREDGLSIEVPCGRCNAEGVVPLSEQDIYEIMSQWAQRN